MLSYSRPKKGGRYSTDRTQRRELCAHRDGRTDDAPSGVRGARLERGKS